MLSERPQDHLFGTHLQGGDSYWLFLQVSVNSNHNQTSYLVGVSVQMNNGTFLLSIIFEYANEISDLNAREQL